MALYNIVENYIKIHHSVSVSLLIILQQGESSPTNTLIIINLSLQKIFISAVNFSVEPFKIYFYYFFYFYF